MQTVEMLRHTQNVILVCVEIALLAQTAKLAIIVIRINAQGACHLLTKDAN